MSRTYNQLSTWKIGSVQIDPSIKWSNIYTHNELCLFAKGLETKLPQLNIVIFETSEYCFEVDGRWNVTLSISSKTTPVEGKNPVYMYLIRRDTNSSSDIGGTYGCPFYNTEYVDDLGHYKLSKNKNYLELVENALEEIIGAGTRITYFHT
jgi:hypothetical protein